MTERTEMTTLTPRERKALREAIECESLGGVGTRKIVSMQCLAEKGFVEPVYRSGLIANWRLTEAGRSLGESLA